jgi:cytochrome c1
MTRKTLGALTIPNTRSYLSAWILDPQKFKPGNKMPTLAISRPDHTKLVNFLRSLK